MPPKKQKPVCKKEDVTTKPIEKPTSNVRDQITAWKNAGIEERCLICALKPADFTWEAYAETVGISVNHLHAFRRENAELINVVALGEAKNEFAPIVKTITARAQNPDEKQAWKYAEMFLDRFGWQKPQTDTGGFYPFNNFWPQCYQAPFIFHRDYSFGDKGNDQLIAFIGGQGSGKTQMGAKRCELMAKVNRGVPGLVTAPSYRRLKDVSMPALRAFLEWDGVPYKMRDSDKEFILWPQSGYDTHIMFRSMDDPDSIRGIEVAWCWPDELRDMDSYALGVMIGRVRHPKAVWRSVFPTTTPNGYDHCYEIFGDPSSARVKTRNSVMYTGSSLDNYFLPKSVTDAWLVVYDDLMYQQEVLGKFVNFGGKRIYYKFDRAVHVKPVRFDSSLPVWIGSDFNRNPMASLAMQPRKVGNKTELHVFKEYAIANADIDTLILALKADGFDPAKWGDRLRVYPDASVFNKSVAAAKSPGQQLNDAGYNLINQRANPFLRDRYAAVNGMLSNASGDHRLFFDPSCVNVIKDMERDVFREGVPIREDSKDGAKERGHWADALGYPVHFEFPIESAYNYNYHSS